MKNSENNLKNSKLIETKTKPDLDDIELIELPPVDFGVHCRRHPSLQNEESSICKRNCKSKEKLISKTNDMGKKIPETKRFTRRTQTDRTIKTHEKQSYEEIRIYLNNRFNETRVQNE